MTLRSSREGITGTGGKHYAVDDALLRGVLASEREDVVYPEDRCAKCEAEGHFDSETCFHRHWTTKKERREAK